jgi:hypothetical protein
MNREHLCDKDGLLEALKIARAISVGIEEKQMGPSR